MNLDISGKTGLVTGASSGIGRGIALTLAAEGVRPTIVARRGRLLEEVAARIVANGHVRPTIIECDLMRGNAATTIANGALAALGSVDILVNNAGGSRKFDLDSTEEQWNEVSRVAGVAAMFPARRPRCVQRDTLERPPVY